MATFIQSSRPVEKANYHHLVMDIAWFGLALAATTRFLQFYALHLGATAMDLGWLTSIPALVLIFATTLSQWWRNRYSDSVQAVWYPGLGHRFLFLLPIFAPFLPVNLRVPWVIFASTLPTVAQGVAASVFAVMMRETIDEKDLQPLLTSRHMAMNMMLALGAGGFGLLLAYLPFPINYQVMFLAAYGFSMMSQWHLGQLRVLNVEKSATANANAQKHKRNYRQIFSDRHFQSVALVVFVGYIAYHFIISVIPIQLKNGLHATDSYMGVYGVIEVSAAFGMTFLLNPLIKRIGNSGMIIGGMVLNACAALAIALAPNLNVALVCAALTGASWSVMAICIFGFFAEHTEKNDMQATIVYHQIAFAAMFIAPMLGSSLVTMGFSVVSVLMMGVTLRIIGAALTYWGLHFFGTEPLKSSVKNLPLDPNEEYAEVS